MEKELPTSPQELMDFLEKQGIAYSFYEHEAVFTVAESDHLKTVIPGQHTRNMYLRDKKKQNFLVTLSDETEIDLKKLSEKIESGRFSFGSPDRLMQYLGVRPGSVTPFSVINDPDNDVVLILEKKMMEQDLVGYHPLINTMTITLEPEGLLRFLEACGHSYRILDLSNLAPDLSNE